MWNEDLKALLGIDGTLLNTHSGDWSARITNQPTRPWNSVIICYELEFSKQDEPNKGLVRRLHLETGILGVDNNAAKVVDWIATVWLTSDEVDGKRRVIPNGYSGEPVSVS
jgi:hypothetical protein